MKVKQLHFSSSKKLTFFLFSDLHFCSHLKNEVLNDIARAARKAKPDYILAAGDMVDTLNEIESEAAENRFFSFIVKLSLIAPVFFVLGNHDLYKDVRDPHPTFDLTRIKEIFKDTPNVYVLDDEVYEDDDVYFFGLTLPPKYYDSGSKRLLFKPESRDILLDQLSKYSRKLKAPEDKVSIFLAHSPVHLYDLEVNEKLRNFDFTLSGHMHDGCVPSFLQKIWPSSRGIIAPNKMPFPKHTRNKKPSDHHIILPAILTISRSEILNSIYSPSVVVLKTAKK